MKTQKYDLAVAYRIYPGIHKTVPIFAESKLQFSEFCLKSFKNALGSLNVKLWVIMDNCPPEYDEVFQRYFDSEDMELIHLTKAGNQATFGKQIEILSSQTDAELVYFAEDDYYFFPNQFVEMVEFIKTNADAHFVGAYDHPDYYKFDIHNHLFEIRFSGNHHWQTAVPQQRVRF